MRPLELLSPARDANCGIEAILHGADAVYIGGPGFGARAAAGNSIDDIRSLCEFAHIYGARIYVTLNTILYDDELASAEALVWDLYKIGVDALIVQDTALLRLNLPPIALHASTQMDNCTVKKAQWLEAVGFKQIVLARETSLEQTAKIANAIKVPIESFIHGALCVSYSGRCYASQYCFGRSANRGKCAQFCRLAFDLIDANGDTVVTNKHLLSLRDMNRTDSLEQMVAAGVSSFKIEGRLKGTDYVKNTTAWYRQRLDQIIARHPEAYRRASFGSSQYTFAPDVSKSFNRGFTEYFLHGRTANPIYTFNSPKATGHEIGRVRRTCRRSFTIEDVPTSQTLPVAGDGLCFIDTAGTLQGFRVNRVEGDEIFPARMPQLVPGTKLFRNADHVFERELSKPSAVRKLALDITLRETPGGYAIDLADESGCHITFHAEHPHESARSLQKKNLFSQLSKMGDTPFAVRSISIATHGERFIPSSVISEWRRTAVALLLADHRITYQQDAAGKIQTERAAELQPKKLTYMANVANHEAQNFYKLLGAQLVEDAFELREPMGRKVLMTCKHCLRHALGICLKAHPEGAVYEPLSLRLPDGRTFPLDFDCKNCEMLVYAPNV